MTLGYGPGGALPVTFTRVPVHWFNMDLYRMSEPPGQLRLVWEPVELAVPGRPRICYDDSLWPPPPSIDGVARMRAGVELDWVAERRFRVAAAPGMEWLESRPREVDLGAPKVALSSYLFLCDADPHEPETLPPPEGATVRVLGSPVLVAAAADGPPVLRITPGPRASRDAVVLEREGDRAKIYWPYETYYLEGWVDARLLAQRPTLARPKPRPSSPPRGQVPEDPIAALLAPGELSPIEYWTVSPNRYPPGPGTSLNVLACVGAFPYAIEEGEYWSFGFTECWDGPRFDYEVTGAPADGVLPVRIADAGHVRPAPIDLPPFPDYVSPQPPRRAAVDPGVVLPPGVQHYLRTFDLFRCRYYERPRPTAPWTEKPTLPDGTPVGPAAPPPLTTCPGDFDGVRRSYYRYGTVYP